MSDGSIRVIPSAIERLAPFVARRERVLPLFIGLSLTVHATVFLPSFFHQKEKETARQEIPVEVVQLPPAAEKPKPAAPKPPAPKTQQTAQKPQPKPEPKTASKPQPKPQVAQKPPQQSGEERMKNLLGPMPAIALPGATTNGDESVVYSQLVLSKVAKAKKQGRYNGIPGAASVAFSLGDAGDVRDVHIVRASGDPTLDEEAIAMVKRGSPYPPPPPGGRRDYAITLRFQAL